jgi:hypothetical protein
MYMMRQARVWLAFLTWHTLISSQGIGEGKVLWTHKQVDAMKVCAVDVDKAHHAAWHGKARHDMARHGMAWDGMLWHGMGRCFIVLILHDRVVQCVMLFFCERVLAANTKGC